VNLRGCNHAAILSQPIRSWESPALNSLAAVLLLTHLLPYRALGFSSPPSVDGDVELHIPAKGVIIQAHVVWAEDCECGVSFGTKYEAEEAAKAVLRFASQP